MVILIEDSEIERLCCDTRFAQRRLGAKGTKKLHARLADLLAAGNVAELAAGSPHPLKGDRLGQFALSLDRGRRLVFDVANDPIPRKEDESFDWSKVTRVLIIFIGDYHD